MLTVKQLKIVSALIILLIAFLNSNSSAQSESKEITFTFPSLSYTEPYGNITYKKLMDYYKSKGYSIDQLAENALLVIPTEIDDKIVITIIWTKALPKSIMDFNVKNEVFYIDRPNNDSLSSEGKIVREYITKEFLSAYRRIQDYSIALTAILSKENFEKELEEFIAKNLK